MLKTAADTLYKIWEHVSLQLETCERDIEAYELRRGFFILPDEILSTVLEYAALQGPWGEAHDNDKRDNEKENIVYTVKSATKLSHVCKRFRDLVIHSPRLWKCVFNGMGKPDMVSTCLSRCRRGNGEITLSSSLFHTFSSQLTTYHDTLFIQAALKRTENWGSFILRGGSESYSRFKEFEEGQLQDYAALSKKLDLPNLTQMDINYPRAAVSLKVRSDVKFHNAMHFYSSWLAPGLQSISAGNFIPIPFSGAGSLASLDITLHLGRNADRDGSELDVRSLASFLSVCTTLETFTLIVINAQYATVPLLPERHSDLPFVANLKLEFICCFGAPLKLLFCAVRFPAVTTMRLEITSSEREEEEDRHFEDIFSAILPNSEAFPMLTDMTLDISAVGFTDRDKGKYVDSRIFIPFSKMPRLRYLVLRTCQSEVDLIPDGMALPSIRTLVLRSCYKIHKNWIVQFLKQMKAQGDLDLLRISIDGMLQSLPGCEFSGLLSKEVIQTLVE